jgi:hypothetical protein
MVNMTTARTDRLKIKLAFKMKYNVEVTIALAADFPLNPGIPVISMQA